MDGIFKLEAGRLVKVNIHRMYSTHGPYVMGNIRLDKLSNVVILVDSSTTTSYETGTHSSKSDTSSVIGRALVGGVLTGGAGAIVGGATAKRRSQIQTETTEVRNIELTLRLDFIDAPSVNVVVVLLESYHWLLGQVEVQPVSDEQLLEQKGEAEMQARESAEEDVRRARVDRELEHAKPLSRKAIVYVMAGLSGAVGALYGINYGTFDISKAFFAWFFCSVFGIVAFIIAAAVIYGLFGTDASARLKYEKKWREVYNRLYER